MQMNLLASIKLNNQFFQPIIISNGKWLFHNSRKKCCFSSSNVTFEYIIKKSYDCVFMDEIAYVANENGNIFRIDLETEDIVCLDYNFGIDAEMYKLSNDSLLVSSIKDEFYRCAYIIKDEFVQKITNIPDFCIRIFGINEQIFFVSRNVNKSSKLSFYKGSTSTKAKHYNTKNVNYVSVFSIDFLNLNMAISNGKMIKIFDSNDNEIAKIKHFKTIMKFGWICNGKYFVVQHIKGFNIYNARDFKLEYEYSVSNNDGFLDINYKYNNNYVCVNYKGAVKLFEII